MRIDDVYGDRADHHQEIMMMTAEELHAAHPFTATIKFNLSMTKMQFNEKAVKRAASPASCILGTAKDGSSHSWVVGNEAGEVLPKFLMAKLIAIESGKVWGNSVTIRTSDSERARLYAMVREAQLRDIAPLAIKKEKGTKRARGK